MTTTAAAVSVVICSKDRPELLASAVAGLASRPPDIELVVVDSASTGTATKEVARNAGATYVRCDLVGLSLARNAGAAAATSDVIAFTDDDCRPTLAWIEAVRARFGESDIGLVTGPIHPDRTSRLATSVDPGGEARFLTGLSDPFEIGHGANMSLRREALAQAGQFDLVMGPGAPFRAAEDIDLMHRALAAGWRGYFDPEVSLTHVQWRTTRQALRTYYNYGIGAGAFASKLERMGSAERIGASVRQRKRDAFDKGVSSARTGYQSGVAANLTLLAGISAGARRARRLDVADGLFVR